MNTAEITASESAVRTSISELVAAIRARDVDAIMPHFAPEVVSFDLAPPLQHGGGDDFVTRWKKLFETYDGAIDYEIKDLNVLVSGDLAFSHSLNKTGGTTRAGQYTERWVRWTACFRYDQGTWLIVHEHVSVPIDLQQGQAVLDLQP